VGWARPGIVTMTSKQLQSRKKQRRHGHGKLIGRNLGKIDKAVPATRDQGQGQVTFQRYRTSTLELHGSAKAAGNLGWRVGSAQGAMTVPSRHQETCTDCPSHAARSASGVDAEGLSRDHAGNPNPAARTAHIGVLRDGPARGPRRTQPASHFRARGFVAVSKGRRSRHNSVHSANY